MEKEHQPDSMATITMKPEYPPSEVYSTSEPPPAYRQKSSNSVQIARIAALTIVASSFILGSFILASSWVAARSSCHQLEQLDAMLDKELALEGRSYGNDALVADEPLPIGNAHALQGTPPVASSAPASQDLQPPVLAAESHLKEDTLSHAESQVDEEKLQSIDESNNKKDSPLAESEESSESDSSAEEDDDLDDMRPIIKLPIQFDLDELAGAFLANSQKGRMNCMVERRHDEPMERGFPFNILGAFAPRSAPQAERIAIICHGGDSPRQMVPEPQSQVFAFPLSGPVRLPLRPQPERAAPAPAHDMPMSPFAPIARQGPFPMPFPWESSEEQQPREMRIHVQRVIAIPARNMPPPPQNMPFPPPPPPQQNREQNEQPTVMHQFVPQTAPTQELEQPEIQKIQLDGPGMGQLPWGLSPEELHAIHRAAEDASARRQQQQQIDTDMQQVKSIVNSLAAAAEAEAEAEARQQQQQQEPQQTMDMPEQRGMDMPEQRGVDMPEQRGMDMPEQRSMDMPEQRSMDMQDHRAARTLMLPQELPMEERPHYMQPRSVRSVDAILNREKREKRVKRCACDCDLN